MSMLDYWIEKIKETKEFKALADTEDIEVLQLQKAIINLMNDQFIESATENGIARREKILAITPFADDTLEDRRFRVLSRWYDKLPYTYRTLLKKLDQMCGEDGYIINLDHNNYSLLIKIELTAKRMFEEVQITTRRIIPANIAITVELRYRQHKELKIYTHGELKDYRHKEIREEALT